MKLLEKLKRGAAAAAAFVLAGSMMPSTAYAQMYNAEDKTALIVQFYAQTGEDSGYIWINDTCDTSTPHFNYQVQKKYTMTFQDDFYADASKGLNMTGFQFAYYGCHYSKDPAINFTLTDITLYSKGHNPVKIKDYNSISAYSNQTDVSGGNFIIQYDFLDQIPADEAADFVANIQKIDFIGTLYYMNFSDATQVDDQPYISAGEAANTKFDIKVIDKSLNDLAMDSRNPGLAQTDAETEAATTLAGEQNTASDTQVTAAEPATTAPAVSQQNQGNSTAKIVVIVISCVLLFGLLIMIGIRFAKNSKAV